PAPACALFPYSTLFRSQEAGEIDVVARLARVEARRLLELPARRPPSAHHPERLAERVVDPRVTRGQANGVAQLVHRARRHAEPRDRKSTRLNSSHEWIL